MGLLKEIKLHFDLNDEIPEIKCTVFKDNNCFIALAKAPRMNPSTKYIALNFDHFRSYVSSKVVNIQYLASEEQPADIFTKALDKKTVSISTKEDLWILIRHYEGVLQ